MTEQSDELEKQKQEEDEQNHQSRLLAHCELGQYDEIAGLLRKRRGLFLNCVDSDGNTPLHVVRDLKCAELLLEFGAGQSTLNRQNRDGETPLLLNLRHGNVQLAGFYLDNGADIRPPNKHFQHCLHVAAHSGLSSLLDRLLDMRQLDPNQPDRRGNSTLHYAVAFADKDVAAEMLGRLLKETQVSTDTEDSLGRTAFTLAAQSDNLAACRLLRDRGCDLCHADFNGADALHVASATASQEMVRYLVADLAFSVDRCDKLGRSPLFYAVHHAREDNAQQLLTLGAEANRPDRCGRTAIHVAAEKADMRGQTPLHLAAINGRYNFVKRLLQWRRDLGDDASDDFIGATDADGKTARQLALDNGHQQVANLLGSAAGPAKPADRSYPRPQSGKQKRETQAEAREQQKQELEAAEIERKKAKKQQDKENKKKQKEEEEKIRKQQQEEQEQQEAAREALEKQEQKSEEKQAEAEEHADSKADKTAEAPKRSRSRSSSSSSNSKSRSSSSSSSSASSVGRLDNDGGNVSDGNERSDKEDPYLTAKPSWINGDEDKEAGTEKRQQQQKQHQQHQHQSRRLRRSQKEPPNIVALRRRLYMYDSTVMLGRSMNEERRERMYLRGASRRGANRRGQQQQQQRERPSTAVEAERLTDRYRDINQDTRQLLEKWRQESSNDNNKNGGSGGGGGGDSSSRSARPASGRSGSGGYPRPRSQHHQQQQRQPQPQPPPYRRPQSGSRFLDYFPNN
uniref:ANK_REP_REGION domain-containing protein n=1 Tax=Macrostomum lignano TaxID=282301 RepID=A0A1I8FYK4_9PLAT